MQKTFLRLYVGRVVRLRRNTHLHQNASFDSLLSRAGLGHLGNGWIVRGTITRINCLSGLTGPSTQAGTGSTDLQLISSSVTDCQALTCPAISTQLFPCNTSYGSVFDF